MSTLSTAACIICSSGAGLGAGFFGCMLSWADHQKRQNRGEHTKSSRPVAICGIIGSTLFGLGSLVGLYFGPVTLVVVIRAGTLLPANAFFSQAFGLRPLTRDDYLGTLVTIAGVLCFSLFGGKPAPPPDEEEFLAKMGSTGAVLCTVGLLAVLMASMASLLLDTGEQPPDSDGEERRVSTVLAVTNVGGCSSAFMDLAAKGWSAALDQGLDKAFQSLLFWAALFVNVLFLATMRVSTIYGCKRCDVLLFVPLNTVLNIFYSVLAGMVVMEEYKQVVSWPGLLSSSISVLGGVVMLVSGPAHRDEEHPREVRWRGDSPSELDEDVAFVSARSRRYFSEEGAGSIDSPEATHPLQRSRTSPAGTLMVRRSTRCGPPGMRSRTENIGMAELLDKSHPLVALAPQSSSCICRFFSRCCATKEELVRMNKVHRDAASIRRRWHKVKMRLREIVSASEEQPCASRHSSLDQACQTSSGQPPVSVVSLYVSPGSISVEPPGATPPCSPTAACGAQGRSRRVGWLDQEEEEEDSERDTDEYSDSATDGSAPDWGAEPARRKEFVELTCL